MKPWPGSSVGGASSPNATVVGRPPVRAQTGASPWMLRQVVPQTALSPPQPSSFALPSSLFLKSINTFFSKLLTKAHADLNPVQLFSTKYRCVEHADETL